MLTESDCSTAFHLSLISTYYLHSNDLRLLHEWNGSSLCMKTTDVYIADTICMKIKFCFTEQTPTEQTPTLKPYVASHCEISHNI